MSDQLCLWQCVSCRYHEYRGSAAEFGMVRDYLCRKHGGSGVDLEMADIRKERASGEKQQALVEEPKAPAEARCRWECYTCHAHQYGGTIDEFGAHQLYLCEKHQFGKDLPLEMADTRRRMANDRSFAKRGYGSRIYLDGIAKLEAMTPEQRKKLLEDPK